jgi:hypothetical protein
MCAFHIGLPTASSMAILPWIRFTGMLSVVLRLSAIVIFESFGFLEKNKLFLANHLFLGLINVDYLCSAAATGYAIKGGRGDANRSLWTGRIFRWGSLSPHLSEFGGIGLRE